MPVDRDDKRFSFDADGIFARSIAESQYTLNEQQVVTLLTNVDKMKWLTRWKGESVTQEQVTDFVNEIAYRLMSPDEAATCDDEGSCVAYSPAASFIGFYPTDPRLSPNEVPFGYLNPPWYISDGSEPGAQQGDIIAPITSLPGTLEALASLVLPDVGTRFVLQFSGSGTVELELLCVLGGGFCRIYPDGNPLLSQYEDLSNTHLQDGLDDLSDIFETTLDGLAVTTRIVEVDFETSGTHTLTVQFLPEMNATAQIPIGFGGGLRSLRLCGVDIMPEQIVPEFQSLTDGTLQYRLSGGEWQTIQRYVPNKSTGQTSEIHSDGYLVNKSKTDYLAFFGIQGESGYRYQLYKNALYMPSQMTMQQGVGNTYPNFGMQPQVAEGNLVSSYKLFALVNNGVNLANYGSLVLHRLKDYVGEADVLQLGRNHGQNSIGFLGTSPKVKQTVSGDVYGPGVKSLLAALANFGLITDNTVLQSIPEPEAQTGLLTDITVAEGELFKSVDGGAWESVANLCDNLCGYVVIYNFDGGDPLNGWEIQEGFRSGSIYCNIQDFITYYRASIVLQYEFESAFTINSMSVQWYNEFAGDLNFGSVAVYGQGVTFESELELPTVVTAGSGGSHEWQVTSENKQTDRVTVVLEYEWDKQSGTDSYTQIQNVGINGDVPMPTWDDNGTSRRIDYQVQGL